MADPAVLARLTELVGFDVVPGTLNVRLARPFERGSDWQYLAAAEIAPDWQTRSGQAGYFHVPVLIAGRHRGVAFQADEPGEPGYPADQIELFAEVRLREELGLGDGDLIAVTITPGPG